MYFLLLIGCVFVLIDRFLVNDVGGGIGFCGFKICKRVFWFL